MPEGANLDLRGFLENFARPSYGSESVRSDRVSPADQGYRYDIAIDGCKLIHVVHVDRPMICDGDDLGQRGQRGARQLCR